MPSQLHSAPTMETGSRIMAARLGNPSESDRDTVALWAAVVLQARLDIEMEPLDSIDYAHAVHFFTGRGEWAQSRATIADFLNMHPDDVERSGRTCIDQRRAREGLPPLALPQRTQTSRRVVPSMQRPPVRVALVPPNPAASPLEQRPAPRIRRARTTNPFFPNGIPGLSDFKEAA